MVIEIERESRVKTVSALSLFLLLSMTTLGVTAVMHSAIPQKTPSIPPGYYAYLFWTALFLIPVYAALRVYSQWTYRMGFGLRLVMGVTCGGVTAVIFDAFIAYWFGGMKPLVGFEPVWGWPFAALCAFLLAPFRFERETRMARLIIFAALGFSALVLLWI